MNKVQIVGLDGLYKIIKDEAKSLQVTGWDIVGEVSSTLEWGWGKQTSLLGWFAANLDSLKEGVEDLRVVKAQLDEETSYAYEGDRIEISTVRLAPDRLVVVVRIVRYEDNNIFDYSGRYRMWSNTDETAFVLRTK